MLDIIGLIANILGAFLLGYGVLTELPKNIQKQRVEGFVNHLTEFLTTQISKIRELPSTAYPESEKSQLIEELEAECQPKIDGYLQQLRNLEKMHSERTYDLGWYGVALLVFGFVLQIIGVTTNA